MSEHVTHSHAPSELEHHGSGGYWMVWAALMVLTLITVWTGQMHMPTWGLLLAIVIATTKATLVVLFFMHLWEQKGVNRVTFIITIGFVILLGLGVFGDLLTRLDMSLPERERSGTLQLTPVMPHQPGVGPGASE